MNVGSFCDFAKVQFLDNYRDKSEEEGHFGQDTTAKTGGSSGNVFFCRWSRSSEEPSSLHLSAH